MATAYATILLPTIKEVSVPNEMEEKAHLCFLKLHQAIDPIEQKRLEEEFDVASDEIAQYILKQVDGLRDAGYDTRCQQVLAIAYGGIYIEL